MTDFTHGKILPRDVNTEMKQSYVDYAMSVIVGRALPDVRDGLKPVHRRILYAMNDLGLGAGKPYKKSARVVGEVLGKYHPHGDVALYDTMVRMAQDFSYRYPLVDGHGNFGSIDGDSAAAMRYTEVRMDKLASVMLQDIDKETVDYVPNFDETLEVPVCLPSRFPNLLVNGAAGIAVGMATNIPPHNLNESIDGVIALIDNPDVDSDGLMEYIKGPDFPTAGIILGRDGIKKAYNTGRGSVIVRGDVRIESNANGKQSLIITELPYLVNKARLIEKIAELVRDKKLEGITDLRDETDRHGIRVVIELRKDANPHVVLNKLYKNTQLQQSFGIIMLALVDNQPKVLSLRDLLWHYLEHQRDIIRRRTRYELRKAEERLHILEGFRVALDNLDQIIATIRKSKDVDEAREKLMTSFPLSRIQAQAILDMRLQRLTALERTKIEEEYNELKERVKRLKEILANPYLVDKVVREELLAIKEKFGDERRTKIVNKDGDIDVVDLIADEDVVITITHQGYIKRLPVTTYRSQLRGGRGITALTRREDDFVELMYITSTHQELLFFTNLGQVYKKKVYEIPESSRQARGTALVNLIQLRPQEKISAVIPIREFCEDQYLVMSTRKGYVKRTQLTQYETNLRSGLIGIKLDQGDELIGVQLTDGNQQLMLVTAKGLSIRFNETEIRTMGRVARGVRGINLAADDALVDMVYLRDNGHLLVVTERGFGKRTRLDEFRVQTRGGKGIKAINVTAKNGAVVVARLVTPGDDVMIVTAKGIMLRQKVDGISIIGRSTQGLTLIKLDTDDRVVAVARVVRENEA
ncbi:MAG: DNA gyrase subunit A [Firmicutes bacterium]|nr:DNA gyrase subunit A [Bacillota bacterium]